MLGLIVKGMWLGFADSFRGFYVAFKLDGTAKKQQGGSKEPVKKTVSPARSVLELRRREKQLKKTDSDAPKIDEPPDKKPRALSRVFSCAGINVLCVFGVYLIRRMVAWMYGESDSDERTFMLSLLLQLICIFPLFLLTRLVNVLWFQDIANASLRHAGKTPSPLPLSHFLADIVLGIALEIIFLLQTLSVPYLLPVPVVGQILGFAHMALLHSLYSFEYYWISLGVGMKQRIQRLQNDWPYFIGFGLPLTVASLQWESSLIISGCLFGALFPFFLISSYQAEIPPPSAQRLPPFPIFSPSLYICNQLSVWIFSRVQRTPNPAQRPTESPSIRM